MIYKERELIKSALLEVEMRELRLMESAPDVSIDASDEYTCKINDIINQRGNVSLKTIKFRKAIIVAAIIASVLMLLGFAFKNFIINAFEKYTAFDPEEELKEAIEERYEPSYLPEGFEETEYLEFNTAISTIWTNKGETVILEQGIGHDSRVSLDTQFESYKTILVGEYTVYYVYRNNTYSSVWIQDGYVFCLTCTGDFSLEEMTQIIASITVTE